MSSLNLKQALSQYGRTSTEPVQSETDPSQEMTTPDQQLTQEQSTVLQSTSLQSRDLESSGVQFSPLQRVIFGWMKVGQVQQQMITLAAKFWPPLKGAVEIMNDPVQLHYAIHMMVCTLQKGLEDDHLDEVGNRYLCERASVTSLGEKGPASVPGWGDGCGEVDADRGSDSGVPGGLLGAEVTSEGINL